MIWIVPTPPTPTPPSRRSMMFTIGVFIFVMINSRYASATSTNEHEHEHEKEHVIPKNNQISWLLGAEKNSHRIFPAAQLELYTTTTTATKSNHDDHVDTTTTNNNKDKYKEDELFVGWIKPNTMTIVTFGNETVITTILNPAIQRFQSSLLLSNRLPDYADDYPINPNHWTLKPITTMEIYIDTDILDLYHGISECYNLTINDYTKIILKAETVFGALHGLETLAQLMDFGWLEKEEEGKERHDDVNNGRPSPSYNNNNNIRTTRATSTITSTTITTSTDPALEPVYVIHGIPLYIQDGPAYPYRGLMIDTARHYLPMNLILQNLNVMAMNKMNILHWHLTDRESFPYQTETLPELADKGAYHPKMIYTTRDIQTVIHEAYLRGIRVIPEVDLPGHTNVIRNSHPELMSHCPLPSEPIDPTNPNVYTFVKTIYNDLKNLFTDDFVHLGGDEVNFDCWNNSVTISKWMKDHNMTDTVELYEYFETKLLHIVNSDDVKKTPIVWQEVFNLNLTISNNTIVDVWKGFDTHTIEQAVNQSYRVILSGCWYLDHLTDSWETYYKCDPRNFNGTDQTKALMMGGHASMWGEHVDASNFISRVWPRASAAAERLWKGNVSVDGAEHSINDRIYKFRCRMVQQGFAASPTAPGVCPHEVPYQQF